MSMTGDTGESAAEKRRREAAERSAQRAAERRRKEVADQRAEAEKNAPDPIGMTRGTYASTQDQNRPGLRDISVADTEAGILYVAPGYYQGAEMMFAGASEEAILDLQYRLVMAGLLPEDGGFYKGVWDPDTMGAFEYVLGHANRRGVTWEAALDEFIAGGADLRASRRPKGPKGPTFTPRLTNPDDLKKVFRQVTYNTLGGQFVDEAQLDQMAQAYQQVELGAQRSQFNAQVGGGGTTVEQPAPDTFAETQLEQIDEDGAEATKFAGYVGVLESLIGGGSAGG
jgi:hypothetical protein